MASRASSGKVLNAIAKNIPWMLGGSADLAPRTRRPDLRRGTSFSAERPPVATSTSAFANTPWAPRNGMALCGLRSYGSTFFVFSDYVRPAMRLAALMKLPVFYIFTHDSIGVGEDGPTHQPVEHSRPACDSRDDRDAAGDANEVVAAYEQLTAEGIAARVVSLPCWELFDAQPAQYRNEVLPPTVTARVAVETGVELGWQKYVGPAGGSSV
jgi:transketolase